MGMGRVDSQPAGPGLGYRGPDVSPMKMFNKYIEIFVILLCMCILLVF